MQKAATTASETSSATLTVADVEKAASKTGQSQPKVRGKWRNWVPFTAGGPIPVAPDVPPELPLAHASFFSQLIFHWVQPVLRVGYLRPLQAEDLWKLDSSRECHDLADRFITAVEKRLAEDKIWNERLRSGEYKPAFLRKRIWWPFKAFFGFGQKDGSAKAGLFLALNDVFGRQFWLAGCIKVLSDGITTTTPLVTKALILFGTEAYYTRRGVPGYSEPELGRGVGLALGLFFMIVSGSLLLHQFFSRSTEVGVLARATLIAAIYRNALQLSGKARAQIPSSRLIAFVSTDVSRIDFAAGFAHLAWTSMIQFVIVLIILLVNLGPSSLVGIAFMLIMIPFQTMAMKSMFKLRRKTAVWTDKRTKLIQELLGGVKVIKLFSWEAPYLAKLNGYRNEELKKLRTLLIIRAGSMAVALSIPVIASVLAFVVYSATGHPLNPAIIFTSLTLFNLLRRLVEVFTADKAAKPFEHVPGADFAVKVENGSFQWEAAPPEVLSKKDIKKAADKQVKKDKADGKARRKQEGQDEKRRSGAGTPSSDKQSPNPNQEKGLATTADEKDPGPADVMDVPHDVGPAVPLQPMDEKTVEHRPDAADVMQLSNINITIPRGQLIAIVGSVGAGKTSFLSALIGDMKRVSGTVQFGGSIGYCAQTAWIQNCTLRDNVLFGQPWNEARYWKAIKDACLEPDIAILPDGDMTEIGEKGINLSGGQRQRVGIARALYFDADIVALDDPLSAVDAHVGQYLFEHAIQGALAGKTRILVTHALHFLPKVDYILVIDHGRITEQGTYEELMQRGGAFSDLLNDFGGPQEAAAESKDVKESEAIEAEGEEKQAVVKAPAVKLMQEEERAVGSVGATVFAQFIKAAKGQYMVPIVLLTLFLTQASSIVGSYWLVWWSQDQFNRPKSFYEGLYAVLGIATAVTMFLMGASAAIMGFNASGSLHAGAAKRVLMAPMSLFDTTPMGRILGRFTKDQDTIDNQLNDSIRMALSTFGQVLGSIVLIAIVNQYFLIAVAVILLLYYKAAQFYRASAREIKRLDNILRSGLYAHFSESLSGLATIRAYGEHDRFLRLNEQKIDMENRAYLLTVFNQRWLGVRLDFFGALLAFAVAIISVSARHSISPSQIGLILSYIIAVQASFSWMVRQVAEVENDMTSTERLLHYANTLEQEAPMEIPATKPVKGWPSQGAIEFSNVVMSYRTGLPAVLKGLSLSVQAGEKIGIVGRTGAGKSSLMQALLRIVELTEGQIVMDGVDISKIGLSDLRQAIAIIPQEALLFNGTIRTNLDPFGVYNDQRLWDALRRAWLVDSPAMSTGATERTSTSGNRFNLDTVIEDEGGNLSVGERSLVSLARALVKDSKVVVLDEATASVDYATDSKIQETIRTEFADKTLLCIAHRLRTIISYDRVLVMDQGQAAEFDTPANLFQFGGIFHGMCERSNITGDDITRAHFEEDPLVEDAKQL